MALDINVNSLITITEDDVISTNLSFNDSEIYSWYRLSPQGGFINKRDSDAISGELTFYIEEYAEIWGARAYDFTTNYFNVSNKQKFIK